MTEVERLINEAQLTRKEFNEANLTLATLCDMVLGEDARDRSNNALIRAVRLLIIKAGWSNQQENIDRELKDVIEKARLDRNNS